MACLQSKVELKLEADYLHVSMFGCRPGAVFVRRYIAANQDCEELHADPSEIESTRRLISIGANVAAIEAALRSRKHRHLLSRKMILVSYIAECDGEHGDTFEATIPPLHFWLILPYWGARALIRLVLGKLLMVRYGI